MKYNKIKILSDEEFRRLTGLKRISFEAAVEILRTEDVIKQSRGGRKSKLCIEDKLLLTLEYHREYRTYFHIAKSYGVSESSAFYTVGWVENILSKQSKFELPGKEILLDADNQCETIIIDATESPIERPKVDQEKFYSGKKKAYYENTNCG